MNQETVDRLVTELLEGYPGAKTAREGGIIYVSLGSVGLPQGCQPVSTRALVVLDGNQAKPQLLVADKPVLPNGKEPKNVSPAVVLGEGWFQFSFNLSWDEGVHTAEQFVGGSLNRFARHE